MRKAIILMLVFVSYTVLAQKTKVESGNFENLKNISEFNLVFDYEGLNVDGFTTEEAYIADKLKMFSDDAIEHGWEGNGEKKGREFKKEWNSDKKGKYEPKFIESFKKRFKGEVKADKQLASAKYTATVKTTYIHPGCMACDATDSSKMNAIITVTENANPGNVLLVYSFVMDKSVPTKGGAVGFDAWAGGRVSETYAKLAKEFAADLKKTRK